MWQGLNQEEHRGARKEIAVSRGARPLAMCAPNHCSGAARDADANEEDDDKN